MDMDGCTYLYIQYIVPVPTLLYIQLVTHQCSPNSEIPLFSEIFSKNSRIFFFFFFFFFLGGGGGFKINTFFQETFSKPFMYCVLKLHILRVNTFFILKFITCKREK